MYIVFFMMVFFFMQFQTKLSIFCGEIQLSKGNPGVSTQDCVESYVTSALGFESPPKVMHEPLLPGVSPNYSVGCQLIELMVRFVLLYGNCMRPMVHVCICVQIGVLYYHEHCFGCIGCWRV